MIILVQDDDEVPPVEPPVIHPEFGFGLQLVGTDGTVWDLATGPVYALAGTNGFGAPAVNRWWRDTAAFDGSSHRGYRTPMREVDLPVEVNTGTNLGWLDVDRALWKSLDPAGTCRLYVTTPEAVVRYLVLRYDDGGDETIEIDPAIFGQSIYPLKFTAGDPYWLGEEVVVTYEDDGAPAAFFPGPPFSLAVANSIQTGTVTNAGDVKSWPRWEIEGPYTAATVGLGTSLVTLDTPILANQLRIIDMDPAHRTITDENGDDAWLEATVASFAAIPPGENVELALDITGSGSGTRIELSFDQRFRRAW